MFFNIDKRILYVIIGVFAFITIIGYAKSPENLVSLICTIPGVLVAITFHEYAHAFAAYKLGDDTAKMQGRLTLNPFKHTDPIGMLMLLFVGFGWGRPVQVDPRNLNRKCSVSKATAIISFAGPLANFILAILFSVITALVIKFNLIGGLNLTAQTIIITVLELIIATNVGLGVFNLIPLPPLDGSKILSHFLPFNARNWFENNEQLFYYVFLFLWITRLAERIITPVINLIYQGLFGLIVTIIG